MLENLLIWSLSQMESIKPKIRPFDLSIIVEETIVLFREISFQKQINMHNEMGENIPTYADEQQIKMVLRNLLNNAIKFTPNDGNIAISANIREHVVNIKIRDSGIGIKEEDLAMIFSNPKLNRGTAGEKGTGFGLFLCKELIEKNGGSIDIKSEFKKGTTIDIVLPSLQ
jgi:signal transduction histidine kinase